MAPTNLLQEAAEPILHRILARAATSPSDSIPLVSIFALIGASGTRSGYTLGSRSLIEDASHHLQKRQQYILAIPTTYDTINNSPAPGAVAGITLGAVLGSIFLLWLILLIIQTYTGRSRVVKTEIIEKHNHRSRSRKSRSRARSETVGRRKTTKEEVRIERSVSRPAREESVMVEEEEDDIVEVIEEHSPERRPSKRTSGFRTVDPSQFGGGNEPRRGLGRR